MVEEAAAYALNAELFWSAPFPPVGSFDLQSAYAVAYFGGVDAGRCGREAVRESAAEAETTTAEATATGLAAGGSRPGSSRGSTRFGFRRPVGTVIVMPWPLMQVRNAVSAAPKPAPRAPPAVVVVDAVGAVVLAPAELLELPPHAASASPAATRPPSIARRASHVTHRPLSSCT